MTAPQHPAPEGRPGDRHPDPLAMTPGEKVAAEWEARHDVSARGHHADPAAVQHYLAESRTHDSRTHEAQRSGSTASTAVPGPPAAPGPHPAAPAAGGAEPPPSRRRRWWPFGRRG